MAGQQAIVLQEPRLPLAACISNLNMIAEYTGARLIPDYQLSILLPNTQSFALLRAKETSGRLKGLEYLS